MLCALGERMHKWDIFINDTLYRVSFQLNQALTFTCTHNNPTRMSLHDEWKSDQRLKVLSLESC